MNELIYKLIRKATIPEYKEECMGKLLEMSNLDYRTIRSLIRIVNNETGVVSADIEKLLDPNFYTYKNMVLAAKDGFLDIIPYKFFEDEAWLTEAKVTCLPIDFVKGYKRIKTFIIRPQISYINGFSFAKCENLEHVIITGNPHLIGDYAFRDCKNLKIDYLPDGVEVLGKGCFKGCESISEITLPDSLRYIDEDCFRGCTSLYGINTGEKGMILGAGAFAGCTALRDINATILGLGKDCFSGCSKLSHIEVKVDEIPKHAFAGCRSLKRLIFEEKTPSRIHREAMVGCDNLHEIYSTGFSYQLRECDGYYTLAQNTIENRKRFKITGSTSMDKVDVRHLIANRLAREDNNKDDKVNLSFDEAEDYLPEDLEDEAFKINEGDLHNTDDIPIVCWYSDQNETPESFKVGDDASAEFAADSLESFFLDIWDDYLTQKWEEERDRSNGGDEEDGFVYQKTVHNIVEDIQNENGVKKSRAKVKEG